MTRNEKDVLDPRASFTLAEVAVSALLMLIVIWALLSAFVSANRSNSAAQTHLAAQQIARTYAEQIWTNVYSNIVSITNIALSNTPLASLDGRVSRTVIVETNNYKDISIVVDWLTPATSRRQSLTNYVTICDTNM